MHIILKPELTKKIMKDGYKEFKPRYARKHTFEFCSEDLNCCVRIDRPTGRYRVVMIRSSYPYSPKFEEYFSTIDEAMAYAVLLMDSLIKTQKEKSVKSYSDIQKDLIAEYVKDGEIYLCIDNLMESLILEDYTKSDSSFVVKGISDKHFICYGKGGEEYEV